MRVRKLARILPVPVPEDKIPWAVRIRNHHDIRTPGDIHMLHESRNLHDNRSFRDNHIRHVLQIHCDPGNREPLNY
jgi:hypothetical protein